MAKCQNDICPRRAVPGSEWCEDHMPENEARERLAQLLEKMEAQQASYMSVLQTKKTEEETIALAQAKQDFEKTAPQEAEERRKKAEAKFEQGEIQGEFKEMVFADYVRSAHCPQDEIFLEAQYLNQGLDGNHYIVLNGVSWPVKPDAVNKIPWPFAADYRSRIKAWAYLRKIEDVLSVGGGQKQKPHQEWRTDAEYEALLTKARLGLL